MKKNDYKKLAEQVCALPGETILTVTQRCDGHTIIKPEWFVEAGLPTAAVNHLTQKHRSDDSPRGTIFVDGKAVKELTGVYGLDLLRFLANALDVPYRPAMGRGTEARNIKAALKRHFEPPVLQFAMPDEPGLSNPIQEVSPPSN